MYANNFSLKIYMTAEKLQDTQKRQQDPHKWRTVILAKKTLLDEIVNIPENHC